MQNTCKHRNCSQCAIYRELIEEERKIHLVEVKRIEMTLEEFACAKERQCEGLKNVLDRLTPKLDKYKAKSCSLNQKIKSLTDTIKSLNDKITLLQETLKISQEQTHRQKKLGLQQVRLNCELRQIITLQEAENKQLTVRVRMEQQEIQNLQNELLMKSQHESKIKDIGFISEEQYQRQAALLRENLKLQFSRSTDQLLKTLPQKEKHTNQMQETEITKISVAEEELRMLANFCDYGQSYFSLHSSNDNLTLRQSKNIMAFLQDQLDKNQRLSQQVAQLQELKNNLTQQMKDKLSQMEEILSIHQKSTFDVGTQTPTNDSIEQLTRLNGFYRLKVIQLQHVAALLVHFAAFLFHLNLYKEKKIHYYRRIADKKRRPISSTLKNKFKVVALSIFFVVHLKKRSSKASSISSTSMQRFEINNANLQTLIFRFLCQRDRYSRKNPVFERIMRQRAKVTSENAVSNLVNLLNEEIIGMALSKHFPFSTQSFDIDYS